MTRRERRDSSLPWVIVFMSAAMTLASTTVRTRAAPGRTVPARSKPAGAEPGFSKSCPCPRGESPDPVRAPGRGETWLRAAGPSAARGEEGRNA